MKSSQVTPIGKIAVRDEGMFVELDKKYVPGLQGLEGFDHLNIVWWFSEFDSPQFRTVLQTEQPYKGSPEVMGIFATRSPIRPNPIALTTVQVLHTDYETGVIQIAYIDANDESPVLDIKPYTPSLDRVEEPAVPQWCAAWPRSTEQSGDFDWESVFNF